MNCTRCGVVWCPGDATVCSKCSGASASSPVSSTDGAPPVGVVGTMVPTGNKPALLSYYCGLFSVVPYLGYVLAPTAIVAGVIGLVIGTRRPEARGRIHAIVGIVAALLLGALGHVLRDRLSVAFESGR